LAARACTSPLSLHDALPISGLHGRGLLLDAVVQQVPDTVAEFQATGLEVGLAAPFRPRQAAARAGPVAQARFGVEHVPHVFGVRSEEHTSELQSRENLVCRL